MNRLRVVDNTGVDGPRACRIDELPSLLAAANQLFRPRGGDMGHDYPLLFAADNLANLRVITAGGAVVAHAGMCLRRAVVTGITVSVGAVGAVFTQDGHRNRGLASAVVGDALAQARSAGATLALVSGDGPLYRRLGFLPAPAALSWACPPPASESRAGGDGAGSAIEIRPCGQDPNDVDVLARLNDAEPTHFQRSAADWRALLAAATLFAWPARIWLVRQGGQPAGYLAVAQRARRQVLELAGDRRAVLAAAPRVSDEIVAPAYDDQTARQARALGWPERALTLAIGGLWLETPDRVSPFPWYGLNYV